MSTENAVLAIAYLVLLSAGITLFCLTDLAYRWLADWMEGRKKRMARKSREVQYPWIDKLVVRK